MIRDKDIIEAIEIAKKRFQEKNVVNPFNMLGGTKRPLRPVYDREGRKLRAETPPLGILVRDRVKIARPTHTAI
jgi:hypothetical protein